jgi:hypothetical protein
MPVNLVIGVRVGTYGSSVFFGGRQRGVADFLKEIFSTNQYVCHYGSVLHHIDIGLLALASRCIVLMYKVAICHSST